MLMNYVNVWEFSCFQRLMTSGYDYQLAMWVILPKKHTSFLLYAYHNNKNKVKDGKGFAEIAEQCRQRPHSIPTASTRRLHSVLTLSKTFLRHARVAAADCAISNCHSILQLYKRIRSHRTCNMLRNTHTKLCKWKRLNVFWLRLIFV